MVISNALRHGPSRAWRVASSAAILASIALWASGCGCSGSVGDTGFGGHGGGGGASGHGGHSQGTGGTDFVTSGTHSHGTATAAGGGSPGCGNTLPVTIRDFSPTTQPVFEYVIADDRGMVETDLGSDHKPVYAGNPTTPTTH